MGRWLIIFGLILIITGGVLSFAPWLINWFGRLPGDIRWESRHCKIFIPVSSMIVVSIVLTVLINLFKR
ncbi:DUF2905 domain-containing protein [Desulfobacterota bacterium M19]